MASRTLATILIACAAITSLGFQSQTRRWPTIKPLQEMFSIQDPDKAVIRTYIRDSKDTPLYLFICRTGEDTSRPDIVYSNDLDCRLLPAHLEEIEDNLLVEETNEKAWFSRGHMVAQQLYGVCGSYPEYGLVRHFRLRGMTLTIEFLDVKFAMTPPPLEGPPSSRLVSYKLRLSVERNRFSKREIAERSGYLDPLRVGQTPSRSCSKIRRGIDK